MSFLKNRVNLLADPIDSSLRLFSIPLVFSFMINMVYALIDRWYVAKLGNQAIAAMGTSDQITFLLFTLVGGYATGTGIIIARRVGEGNKEQANRTATQAVVGMVILASFILAVAYLTIPLLPTLMSMPEDVGHLSIDYLQFLFIGFVGNMLNFQMFGIVRSTGNAMFPMIVLITTVVVNAIIAPFLIFGIGPFPEMGIAGAGLATALAQLTGTAMASTALLSKKTEVHLDFSNFTLDLKQIWQIIALGFPSSLQMLSVSINRIFLYKIVGTFGTTVVAAYTLGLNVDLFVFMSVFAVGVALEVATGMNLGARKIDRIWQYYKSAVKQMSFVMLFFVAIVYFLGHSFVGLYSQELATVDEATTYLHITVLGYLFFSAGIMACRVISGSGAMKLSMVVIAGSLLGLQLPICYVLAKHTGLMQTGVWIGIVIGYVLFSAISFVVLKSEVWLKSKV